MNRNQLALARPRHILDLQVHGAHVLAALGDIALRAAQSLNDAAVARVPRAVDRAGPARPDACAARFDRERYGVTDAWRVR